MTSRWGWHLLRTLPLRRDSPITWVQQTPGREWTWVPKPPTKAGHSCPKIAWLSPAPGPAPPSPLPTISLNCQSRNPAPLVNQYQWSGGLGRAAPHLAIPDTKLMSCWVLSTLGSSSLRKRRISWSGGRLVCSQIHVSDVISPRSPAITC